MKPQILIWPIQMLHNLFFEQTTMIITFCLIWLLNGEYIFQTHNYSTEQ